jgi:hypothetical protein
MAPVKKDVIIVPDDIITIEKAKEFMRKHLRQGVECPCCKRLTMMYRRALSSVGCRMLIRLYLLDKRNNHDGDAYYHVSVLQSTDSTGTNDFSKLAYWGLIQERSNDNKSKRTSGYWRITGKGKNFVEGHSSLPSHVYIYNTQSFGFDDSEYWNIKRALGKKFNYEELMNS